MFSLFLLVIKSMVFRLFYRLFAPTSIKQAMSAQPSMLGQLLLAEFIFMTPTIIPGLLMDILTPANNTKEYLYKGCSGVVLFAIICTFIYFIISTTSFRKVQIPGDNVPTYKIKFEEDVMVILKLLFLPFAVTGNHPLFLSLVTVALFS